MSSKTLYTLSKMIRYVFANFRTAAKFTITMKIRQHILQRKPAMGNLRRIACQQYTNYCKMLLKWTGADGLTFPSCNSDFEYRPFRQTAAVTHGKVLSDTPNFVQGSQTIRSYNASLQSAKSGESVIDGTGRANNNPEKQCEDAIDFPFFVNMSLTSGADLYSHPNSQTGVNSIDCDDSDEERDGVSVTRDWSEDSSNRCSAKSPKYENDPILQYLQGFPYDMRIPHRHIGKSKRGVYGSILNLMKRIFWK